MKLIKYAVWGLATVIVAVAFQFTWIVIQAGALALAVVLHRLTVRD